MSATEGGTPTGESEERLAPPPNDVPLCVDLDDTLIRTDLFVEGLITFLRDYPAKVIPLLRWFRRGRAYAKTELTRFVTPAVDLLPFRASIIDLIIQRRKAGSKIVLATAAPQAWADKVAEHLGLFDEVIATSATDNCKGSRKEAVLVERYGAGGFDYVGDSAADIAVWRSCRVGYVIAGQAWRKDQLPPHVEVVPRSQRSQRSPLNRWLRALRVHQWSKNLLIFVPLLMAHRWSEGPLLFHSVAAGLSFSLAASAVYLFNDLLDLNSDRAHRTKCHRPFASGEIAISCGLRTAALCGLASFVIGASIAAPFLPVLLLYLSLTTLYSLVLKRIPIVDIFVLASLYTLRIFAGAAATSITVSPWLLAFSLFFFLGLASVKRYVEFSTTPGASESSRRGYKESDTTWIGQLGMGTGLISVLVLALYIQAPDVTRLYRNPAGLWLLAPIVLFWIVRVWFLAHRHELHDDPVVFALRDPISLTIGAAAATILLWSM